MAIPAQQDPGFHESERGRVQIENLPVEQRQRVRRLWNQVVCACPNENWSRTLTNCMDACADPGEYFAHISRTHVGAA
jgi:hypothetical protein